MPIFNAIQKAREAEVDLVEVGPNAVPPVCKIINFKKFKYIEAKKEKEEKKGQKKSDLKELLLTPFMAENDLQTRINKTRNFIKDNNKVKIRIRFRGNELGKKDFGYRQITKIAESLTGIAVKENEPKFMGRELFVVFVPAKNQ